MDDFQSVKVVLLGESGVGKTSIIARFTSNSFDPDCITSLSAQFISKNIAFPDIKKNIKFDIWDTAGQERYRSLAKIFYKDAKIVIFVYDITSRKSFEELIGFWYPTAHSEAETDQIIAVVSNKSDKYDQENAVPDEEGKEFATKIGAIFQSTSALSNQGIETLFRNLGKKVFNPNLDLGENDKKLKEEYERKKREEKGKNKGTIVLSEETNEKNGRKKCCGK